MPSSEKCMFVGGTCFIAYFMFESGITNLLAFIASVFYLYMFDKVFWFREKEKEGKHSICIISVCPEISGSTSRWLLLLCLFRFNHLNFFFLKRNREKLIRVICQ